MARMFVTPGKTGCSVCGSLAARYSRGSLLCVACREKRDKFLASVRAPKPPVSAQVQALTRIVRMTWKTDLSIARRARSLRTRVLNSGKTVPPERIRRLWVQV